MKQSKRIALGGLLSALSLVFLFMTGLFPFATLALPALAGALFAALVIECGTVAAVCAYLSVSLLGIMLTPDQTAAILFLAFFGYYPILKSLLEQKAKKAEWLLKLLTAAAAMTACYLVFRFLFPDPELIALPAWLLPIGLIGGLVIFILYDIALSRLIGWYLCVLRPKLTK